MKYQKFRNRWGHLPWRRIRNRTGKKLFKRLNKEFGGKNYLNWIIWCWKNLKPGDLIETCKMYNGVVKSIEWGSNYTDYNNIATDAEIVMEDGMVCSLRHCCDRPKSKNELIRLYKSMPRDKFDYPDSEILIIKNAVENHIDIFNEDGTVKNNILDEFKNEIPKV